MLFDSKPVDAAYISNYGDDSDYKDIIEFIESDSLFIRNSDAETPDILWKFSYTEPGGSGTPIIVEENAIDYKRLKQLFDENKHIRSQNPLVSVKKRTGAGYMRKRYPIRKICEIRPSHPHIEKEYKNKLDNPSRNTGGMRCKSIKYGTNKEDPLNWYICPRLYDKQTNRPLHWTMLKYSHPSGETFEPFDWGDEKNWRKAKHDIKLDITDFNPEYPKDNPEPDRLYIYPKSGGVGGGGAYFYPGFLSHTKHPLSVSRIEQNKEPIFPPCCYQKYSNRFDELLYPKSPKNVNTCGEPISRSGDKYFTISNGIEGNLGKKLNKLFGQEECNTKNGFIRHGIDQGGDAYFNLIFDIFNLPIKTAPTSIKRTNVIKDTIVKSITYKYINNKNLFFNDINGGFLEILFRKRDIVSSFQNFIEYTLSDDVKRYDLFYEITTSPQFIQKFKKSMPRKISDLILIVFEISKKKNQSSYSIKINCPYFSKKMSENLNDLNNNTHVALAIKYNNITSSGIEYIFEPIYYKMVGGKIDDVTTIRTFKISEIYSETYNEKTGYLQKIKNILEKFKEKCYISPENISLDKTPLGNIITYKKLVNFITLNTEALTRQNIHPSRIIKDTNNKVSGINFKYGSKIYTIPVFPESVDMVKIKKLSRTINKRYYDNEQIFHSAEVRGGDVPKLAEYEEFYNIIGAISKKSIQTSTINIKPLRFFGLFVDSDAAKINLDVRGFAVSFLSDADSTPGVDISKTLVYIACNGGRRRLREDQIIYNYADIDKFIFDNEKEINNTQPLNPVEIGKDKENSVFNFLKESRDFGISTLYRDNSKHSSGSEIVLIKTNHGVFIPIMPLDKSSDTWSELNFSGDIEELYTHNIPYEFSKSIKIEENLLSYCKKIKDLSKTTNFQLPIFIKNFNINNINNTERRPSANEKGSKTIHPSRSSTTFLSSVYLESGLLIAIGDGKLQPIEISVMDPVTSGALKILGKESDDTYTINEVKKCNLNFYTQRYINDNNLNISLDYQREFQATKFKYDSIIYEVLIKKLNEFFSLQLNKSVKQIKLFIKKVISNDILTKDMHDDVKKRLLYPLIYEILNIIIKPIILEGELGTYPDINISDVSNIESDTLVNLEDFSEGDVDRYIKQSYTLMNNDIDTSVIDAIPISLRDHKEYHHDATDSLDFTKVTKLYYDVKETYRSTNYIKLEILDHETVDMPRSEILKHKICNNLIYNNFIQEQVFGIYKPNISSNSRFKYNMGFEILFTKSEKDNYEKLNSLYAFTKQKYFREIDYPESKELRTGKIYKFKETGKSKVIPFLYRFQRK